MDPRPKCEAKTINLPKDHIGGNICDDDLGKECLDIVLNIRFIKE